MVERRACFLFVLALLLTLGCSSAGKKKVVDDVAGNDLRGEPDLALEDLRQPDETAPDLVPDDAATDMSNCPDGCEPPCESDDDCGFCESCDTSSGQCLPIPCPVECVTDEECNPGEHCETLENGCCGHCVVDDPCAVIDCIKECEQDNDCDSGESCIQYAEGCCSECQPQCELCTLESGTWCAGDPPDALCEVGTITVEEVGPCWFEIQYVGEDGTDLFLADGCQDFAQNLEVNGCGLQFDAETSTFEVACNWCGEVEYAQDNCECTPNCQGKECGPDGCGGSCGSCDIGCFCSAGGQCTGCSEETIEVDPICAHAPSVVGAGAPFAVAIYGLPGCSEFDHYEVDSEGTSHHIRIFATASADPDCPPLASCNEMDWSYLGLVWINAPNPGAYNVKVGNSFEFVVGASGGLISEPACQDDCGTPLLENYDWTLKALADTPVMSQCLDAENALYVGEQITFTGTCQDYVLEPVLELPAIPIKHCTDGHLLFGEEAPYWMEGTVCGTDPMIDGHLPVILGTIQDSLGAPVPTQAFLVEGSL